MSEDGKAGERISPQEASVDEVRILSFKVGHGDCTLIEYWRESRLAFRCVVDAGKALPAALLDHIAKNPREDDLPAIDVLVLSHVDWDHQGGLSTLVTSSVSIGQYLGPCLPTFRRLKWLFAPRVQNAIGKAEAIEKQLAERNIPIIYPLEGYTSRHANGRVTLSVISPAARLLKRLSIQNGTDLSSLLARHPLPLEWMLEVDPVDSEIDEEGFGAIFDRSVGLSPRDFRSELPRIIGIDKEGLEAAAKQSADMGPDFFGNSVLNDTSIVVVLDVLLEGRNRKRILLPGDQENWTYIAAQHPTGFGLDALKAPHHGGRMYLGDAREDLDGLYVWLRPKTVFVSASGDHNLPRVGFRDALRRVGATLLCPNRRSIEPLSAGAVAQPDQRSCYKSMACKPADGHVTTLTLRAEAESADAYACVQGAGHSGAAPIIVLKQEVTSPSEIFVRYTRGELENHSNWIRRQLEDLRKEFKDECKSLSPELSWSHLALQRPVSMGLIAGLARREGRHDFVNDPLPVFSFGRAQRMFWTSEASRFSPADSISLYATPSERSICDAKEWLLRSPRILLCGKIESVEFALTRTRFDLLSQADWYVIEGLVAAKLAVPMSLVQNEILPRLLPDIAREYSLRVCGWNYPHSSFHGGDAYFLLERAGTQSPFPDMSGHIWEAIVNRPTSRDNIPWYALHKTANRMLAANVSTRSSGDNDWIQYFRRSWATHDSCGQSILSADWRDIWRSNYIDNNDPERRV